MLINNKKELEIKGKKRDQILFHMCTKIQNGYT